MNSFIKLILFSIVLNVGDGAKILGVFPMTSYSHYILANSLFEALANQGHQVTMINPYTKTNSQNYTNIYLDGLEKYVEDALKMNKNGDLEKTSNLEKIPIILMQWMVNEMALIMNDFIFTNKDVQNLLLNEKFDVVIVEQIQNDAIKGFCYHFNAHCISFSTIPASHITNYIVANPSPPAYVPDIFLPYSNKMTFFQRMHNLLFQTWSYLFNLYYLPKQNEQLHKYFPNAPHVEELNKNISVVFVYSHISTSYAKPHVPGMIEIGGLHIKDPKMLPADLQNYLDNAKEGLIYFSLGSNVKSNELSVNKREEILRALGKVQMKVLWKFEDDNLPNKPSNLKIGKWVPQQDILAHPNLKLFITHGGLLSTTEAVYYGVPLIGIPFFGDQKANMQESIKNGFALQILYKDLNEESLTHAINTILQNQSFYENAKKRSAILRDNPIKPLDNAVYWVEYVLRHNGAHHLKTAGVDLPLYKYLLIDVILFISIIVLLFVIVIYKLIKYLITKICSKINNTKSQKNVLKNKYKRE